MNTVVHTRSTTRRPHVYPPHRQASHVTSSNAEVVAALRAIVKDGSVHTAGQRFTEATTLFNAAAESTPAVVVRCISTADVQATVRAARDHDIPLSVRGGGHDFWGRAVRPDGVVLDLRDMHSVRLDGKRHQAIVGGGATSLDVVSAAERLGMTAVTGTAGAVGMVGLTLGGGYGPLIGRFGLAADNLLGADVVLADGSLVRADAEHHPDLLWALRGGGGNFGVVTSMTIQLHPVASVVSGTILYPAADSNRVLSSLSELLHDSTDDLSVDIGFLPGPDGNPVVYVAPTWAGDLRVGNAEDGPVHRLARLGSPLSVEISPVPRSATLSATDSMFPVGRRGTIRTRTVQHVSGKVGEVLAEGADAFTSPFSAILAHDFHGSAARRDLSLTAFGRRSPHRMVELIALWGHGGQGDQQHLHWAETIHQALEPHSLPGGYVSFLGPGQSDQISEAYGPNAERLLRIKTTLDPDSVFTATPLPERTGESPCD